MKTLIWLIGLIMSSGIVSAIEGNVTVYSIKAFSNSEQLSFEWSDNKFKASPGATIEI